MRKFLLLTTILFGFLSAGNLAAQNTVIDSGVGGDGGGPKQSWSEIYKNPNLKPEFPHFDIEGRSISYNNLCLLGDRIRTKYKHVVKQDLEFKLYFDYLVTDRVRTESVCRREECGECISWEEVIFEIPVHSEIEVLERKENPGGFHWEVSFKKDFELQECLEF